MRFVLALVVALFGACLQAGDRHRCRPVVLLPQPYAVVSAAAPAVAVQPAAAAVPVYAAPVSSCPGGVCPAPSYQPVRGGLFRRW